MKNKICSFEKKFTHCWDRKDVVPAMNQLFESEKKHITDLPHIKALTTNISVIEPKPLKIIDIGCGTASSSMFFSEHHYSGCDLPHIIEGCAKVNFPQNNYFYFDANSGNFSFIKNFNVVLLNGFMDVWHEPLSLLENIFKENPKFVIVHRQELTSGASKLSINSSYGGTTIHSTINKLELEELTKSNNYIILSTLTCGFNNWEDGGHSIVFKNNIY